MTLFSEFLSAKRWRGVVFCGLALLLTVSPVPAEPTPSAAPTDLWRQSIEQIRSGRFEAAAQTLSAVDEATPCADRLRSWIGEYLSKQEARRRMNLEEFELYVGYAKARIERKEYTRALDWTWRAHDVAADAEGFLQTDWVKQLVSESLAEAADRKANQDWRGAWEIYGRLAALFEREPLYEKLEREAVTHLRLETMFKDGFDWREHIERVRWEDAEEALEHVNAYYVEPADFKKMAESGLEQLLLLAESKAAQEALDGLKDEADRLDFRNRVQERLNQVRAAPKLDAAGCVAHFRRVVLDINRQTVRLPQELIVSELMRGALEPLDEFTTVIWPKETEDFEKHTRGNFIGVGIQIYKNRANEIEVQTPLDDTPAYRNGIRAGDVITAVDGKPLNDVSLNKVVEIITGPKGTPVTLTIRREDKLLDFALIRDEVKIQSVKGVKRDAERDGKWNHWLDPENGIAYVRVTNFQKTTVEDVQNALRELRTQGLRGIVLDLRGNPGGLLDSAWQMSTLFLKRGERVVSTGGRIKEENQALSADHNGDFSDLPLAVLVDEASASASEIVSGAVRDNKRGLVIGERTFGKFSVQNLIPLSHSQAKLKITTARYYLPSGVSLHRTQSSDRWGVEPDIPIRLVRWERVNLWEMRREADLLGPPSPKVRNEAAESDDTDEDSEGGVSDSENAEDGSEAAEGAAGPAVDSPASADFVGPPAEPPLPPLKQPDKNLRPKTDPQLDAALLVMRATLLGNQFPTLAAAEKREQQESRAP
jgi:carboxyl-terminal processing protease